VRRGQCFHTAIRNNIAAVELAVAAAEDEDVSLFS
jgi:hypothetical protein